MLTKSNLEREREREKPAYWEVQNESLKKFYFVDEGKRGAKFLSRKEKEGKKGRSDRFPWMMPIIMDISEKNTVQFKLTILQLI